MFSLPQKPTYIKFAEDIDFYDLFAKINCAYDTCVLLESYGEESALARYSLIGFDPMHILSAANNSFYIDKKLHDAKNPYDGLKTLLPSPLLSRPYAGGLIGYISYEGINYFEKSLGVKVHPLFPEFVFGVYTDGLMLDKMTGIVSYFYYTKNRLSEIKKIALGKTRQKKPKVIYHGHTITKKQHARMVSNVLEQIRAGNTFQCVIGFKTEYKIIGDTLPLYTVLRRINPSPHMYYLKFKDIVILGASPELLFRLRGREMETFPLAGTIGRGKNDKQDLRLARTLLNDPKEIAEHNMLIDLHRNDLGRVAEFGTVTVRRLMDIKKFSHVQHISSEIAGILAQGHDMFSGLASNFPAGTLTGAPKIESIKIIDSLEKDARGPYGGALGHFGFNGECTFAIPIRSLFVKGNYAYTQNASGIVYDSDAGREYEEIKRKGKAMEKVLNC